VNRRASLPGVDELFGMATGERAGSRDDRPSTTAATGTDVDPRVLAGMRRLTAAEDDVLLEARERAAGSLTLPPPEIGALLRWAVRSTGARAAVEVGSAGGVSGLWVLPWLAERGVLTSIEPDPHAHGFAEQAFQAFGAGTRVRAILGDPSTVLPRLSDGVYDLVLVQTAPARYPEMLDHARRLLRVGGMLLARGVLRPGEHGESLAAFVRSLAEDPSFDAAVLPVDEGLAIATRREDPEPDTET
jgi:predicted O-methyltransferase YrrM